jgi:hypothetical protein
MSNSESTLQMTTVSMVNQLYPSLLLNLSLNGVTLLGSPTQKAQIIQQARREGLTPGIPDLLVYLPEGKVLNWEFKRPKGGVQSQEQLNIQQQLTNLGHHYEIIRSTEAAFVSITAHTTEVFRQAQYDSIKPKYINERTIEKFQHWPVGTPIAPILINLQKLYGL